VGQISIAGNKFWEDIENRYEDRLIDRYRPILHPNDVFLSADSVLNQLKQFPQIQFKKGSSSTSLGARALPDLSSNIKLQQPFSTVQEFIKQQECRILFCAESAGRRETMLELFRQIEIVPTPFEHWQNFLISEATIGICIAPLDAGMWLEEEQLVLITEAQLFGNRVAQRRRRGQSQNNTDFIVKNLTELHINDAVVHLDHGVGRYRGLETIITDGEATEFLSLEYANAAKLYVPVASLHLISRYSGADRDGAPLNHLGSDQWLKTKRKAAEKIHDVAVELLDIYSQREAKKGFIYE
jgi:transcription-repair coupling factor (superfamily II helicase)